MSSRCHFFYQVESTHATPCPEGVVDGNQSQKPTGTAGCGAQSQDVRLGGGNGIVGVTTGASGGGDGGEEKSGVKVQPRRRRAAGVESGRKATQRRGMGYPMTAVAAVLRQLHMRVLSVEEMKMLDQVGFT